MQFGTKVQTFRKKSTASEFGTNFLFCAYPSKGTSVLQGNIGTRQNGAPSQKFLNVN
jgi:hypothetical protein